MGKKVKKDKTKKPMSRYKKSLLAFFLVLLFLSEAAICYVGYALKDFENNNIDNYIEKLVDNISSAVKHGNADKYFKEQDFDNKYEKNNNMNAGYKELFKTSKITYKEKEKNVYDLYADETLIATITLDDSNKATKLGLLNYSKLAVKDIQTYNDDGLFTVDASVSSDYILYINNIKVDDADITEVGSVEGFNEVADTVNVPKTNHYVISKFTSKPEVTATDKDGKDIEVTYEDGKYTVLSTYITDDYDKAMAKLANEINPLDIAEKWSLFLTKDLSGDLYGFYDISSYLISGTTVYKNAYAWATGIDITFTSPHTLDNPIFTNETMKNFVVYDDKSFSVDIHLEKNMHIVNGVTKNDIFDETMYFTYTDNGYKLVSMKTITE